MQSTTSPSAVSKPYHILFPMSATPSERRNCSDLRVKWIGLHPLDMVDRVMLMAEHSAYARSATSSIDVGLLMKRNGAATTSLNAQATDERCQSLLRSILDERKKDMNEHLLNFGQTTQQHIAVSQCPCAHESIRNMMRGPSVAQVNRAPKPSSAKEKNYIYQAMMSNWIFQNWTNPFPDPIQLENLATHLILAQCIVVNANEAQVFNGKSFEECRRCMMNIATKKIETWLVNARLRKWKKSIEYAFDLVSLRHNIITLIRHFPSCVSSNCVSRGVQRGFSSKILVVYAKERHCDPSRDGIQMKSLLLMLAILYR